MSAFLLRFPAGVRSEVPDYSPLFVWSAAGGTLGNTITGWASVVAGRITYSNDVSGPFWGNRVGKVALVAANNGFGGTMVSGLSALSINSGDDVWIRAYHYFPGGFCFSSGNVSESNWGNTKWYRLEFANGNRWTCQMGGLAGTAFADGPTCGTQAGWGGATDEVGGNGENKIIASPPAEVVRGSWLALQSHIHLAGTAVGYVESWIGSTYIGRAINANAGGNAYVTCPSGGSPVADIVFGDYWNGAPYFGSDFYLDEVVITTQTPNTLDAGSRPYISPSHRVSDF